MSVSLELYHNTGVCFTLYTVNIYCMFLRLWNGLKCALISSEANGETVNLWLSLNMFPLPLMSSLPCLRLLMSQKRRADTVNQHNNLGLHWVYEFIYHHRQSFTFLPPHPLFMIQLYIYISHYIWNMNCLRYPLQTRVKWAHNCLSVFHFPYLFWMSFF